MLTQEGTAHFFHGPMAKNFFISCLRLNGTQKKNLHVSPKQRGGGEYPFIAHSYSH